jgi:flagellar basal body-associated protein FliL
MAHQQGPPGQPPNYGQPPGYGYQPTPPPKKSNTALILIILGVGAVVLFGGCAALVAVAGSSTPQVVTATTPHPPKPVRSDDTASQTPADTQPAAAAVGGTLSLEGTDPGLKVDVTVTKVTDPATPANEYLKPKTGNRYVAIEVRLDNKGQAVYEDSPSNGAALIDDQGQQYSNTFGEVREGVVLSGVTVSPGDSRKGVILYEIPKGVKLAKFQFGLNSGFAAQKGEWKLS